MPAAYMRDQGGSAIVIVDIAHGLTDNLVSQIEGIAAR
jgi:hypothetical protein